VVPISPGGLNWLDLAGSRLDLCRGETDQFGPLAATKMSKLGPKWLIDGANQLWCSKLAGSGWIEVGLV
jgi:hypothetical protein